MRCSVAVIPAFSADSMVSPTVASCGVVKHATGTAERSGTCGVPDSIERATVSPSSEATGVCIIPAAESPQAHTRGLVVRSESSSTSRPRAIDPYSGRSQVEAVQRRTATGGEDDALASEILLGCLLTGHMR